MEINSQSGGWKNEQGMFRKLKIEEEEKLNLNENNNPILLYTDVVILLPFRNEHPYNKQPQLWMTYKKIQFKILK